MLPSCVQKWFHDHRINDPYALHSSHTLIMALNMPTCTTILSACGTNPGHIQLLMENQWVGRNGPAYSVWPCSLSVVMAKAGLIGRCLHLKRSAESVLVELIRNALPMPPPFTLCALTSRKSSLRTTSLVPLACPWTSRIFQSHHYRSCPSNSACVEACLRGCNCPEDSLPTKEPSPEQKSPRFHSWSLH